MLSDLLDRQRTTLLKRWFQLIVESYPPDTAGFLRDEKDPFLNPVGSTLSREIDVVFDEIVRETDSDRLSESLDNVIKIRAVQEFTPSQAVQFLFLLKAVLREGLKGAPDSQQLYGELFEVESRIDRAALIAFDLYLRRREKIHEIRTRELRERSGWLMERMNRIYGGLNQDLEGLDPGSSDMKRGSAR